MSAFPADELKQLTAEAHRLVIAEFEKVDFSPKVDSNLDQVNLLEGQEVIIDYVNHGEFGLALDHLMYVVLETEIKPSELWLTRARRLLEQYAGATKNAEVIASYQDDLEALASLKQEQD